MTPIPDPRHLRSNLAALTDRFIEMLQLFYDGRMNLADVSPSVALVLARTAGDGPDLELKISLAIAEPDGEAADAAT